MVSNTPRKSKLGGAAAGWGVGAFSNAVSSAVGGSAHAHLRCAGDDEKDAFISKTTGDVFAPGAPSGGWGSGPEEHVVRRQSCLARNKLGVLGAIGLVLFMFFRYGGVGAPQQDNDFIKVAGTEFELSCRPWYPAGFNAHHLVSNTLVYAHEHKTPGGKKGTALVRQALTEASGMGLNVMRVFAHTTDPNFPLQTGPGEYNEKVFKALDFVLVEARRYGIRVVLSVLDNWKYSGGIDEFVDWSPTSPRRERSRPADTDGDTAIHEYDQETKDYEVARHAVFWSDDGSKSLYKNHIKTLVERVNSISGRAYRDDATIFAWDLVNEPRCETWRTPDCADILLEWMREMAAYVKTLDPNHLVTSGGEGFFGADSPRAGSNPQMPQSKWATQTGQDFTNHTTIKDIDFGGIHVWPDNWEMKQKKFLTKWITEHMDEAEERIHKPLLLEEFGKIVWEKDYGKGFIKKKRDPVYDAMTAVTMDSVKKGGILQGALFWRWDIQVYMGVGPGEYGVRPDHSTFDIIRTFASMMRHAVVATPPRQECEAGCWLAAKRYGFDTCLNDMTVCGGYWNSDKKGSRNFDELTENWPSKQACCVAGHGAYPSGCSAMATLF